MTQTENLRLGISWGLLRSLSGQKFCQTGTMSCKREQMDELIKLCGGAVHHAIKSNTSHLIVPNDPSFRKGSKYKAAQSAGTNIITEQEFCEMILPSVIELLGENNGPGSTS